MRLFKPTWKVDGAQREGRVWWMDAVVCGRRVRKSLGLRDRHAAQIRATEIVRAMELRASGLPVAEDPADLDPRRLVADYEQELVRRRSAPQHVARTCQRVRDLLGRATRLGDVTPERIRRALAALTARGLSPQTVNGYRTALRSFYAWLVREGRWPENPVVQVSRVRPGEPSRERRALTPEELARLLERAPPHRSLCYRVAVTTGLRRSELAALRWRDVDLPAATVRVRSATAKNRREATQPLPEGTVEALRAARGEHQLPTAPVFRSVPSTKRLREDLAAAGIGYETGAGVLDFHALRVTYATMLARAGVSLVQAQQLLRHSDPKLTANVYTRLELHDGHAAVARIDVGAAPALARPAGL